MVSRHPEGLHLCDVPSCRELMPICFTWCDRHYRMLRSAGKTQAIWHAARNGDHTDALLAIHDALVWLEDNLPEGER